MRNFNLFFLLGSSVLFGCGTAASASDAGSDAPVAVTDAGVDTGTPADTGTPVDTGAPVDTGTPDSSALVKLTVQNYLAWCSVSVQGGAATTDAVQTLNVSAGTVVNLSGDKASGTFVWGYWVGTAGDTGTAHDTKKVTTVTVTKDTIVQACCPFANDPTTACPAPK